MKNKWLIFEKMEDRYQRIMDKENARLNERIARIERKQKRVRRNITSIAVIIIAATIYFCLTIE